MRKSTIFDFEHKVFFIEGGYFSLINDVPMFYIPFGDVFGAVTIPTLRENFIKPETHDDELLTIVEKSLRFVKKIIPGEAIPPELLDGTASWSVSDENREVARNKVLIHLSSVIVEKEVLITDPIKIKQILEDENIKKCIVKSYEFLSEKLGLLSEDHKGDVNIKLNKFAHEMAYIEALRERYNAVLVVVENVERLQSLYHGNDRTFSDEILQMQKLFRTPVMEFQSLFDQVDALLVDILSLLKSVDTQINFVRYSRDELHYRMMIWDELLDKWVDAKISRSTHTENLIKFTYRFLAQHFLKPIVWKKD